MGLGLRPVAAHLNSRLILALAQVDHVSEQTMHGIHRTGDYAYIAAYPAAALGCGAGELGILEGETVGPATGTWGTHVAIVNHC